MAFKDRNNSKRPCDVVGTLKLEGNQRSEIGEDVRGSRGRGGSHRIEREKKSVSFRSALVPYKNN
jgi:hypothetical protein